MDTGQTLAAAVKATFNLSEIKNCMEEFQIDQKHWNSFAEDIHTFLSEEKNYRFFQGDGTAFQLGGQYVKTRGFEWWSSERKYLAASSKSNVWDAESRKHRSGLSKGIGAILQQIQILLRGKEKQGTKRRLESLSEAGVKDTSISVNASEFGTSKKPRFKTEHEAAATKKQMDTEDIAVGDRNADTTTFVKNANSLVVKEENTKGVPNLAGGTQRKAAATTHVQAGMAGEGGDVSVGDSTLEPYKQGKEGEDAVRNSEGENASVAAAGSDEGSSEGEEASTSGKGEANATVDLASIEYSAPDSEEVIEEPTSMEGGSDAAAEAEATTGSASEDEEDEAAPSTISGQNDSTGFTQGPQGLPISQQQAASPGVQLRTWVRAFLPTTFRPNWDLPLPRTFCLVLCVEDRSGPIVESRQQTVLNARFENEWITSIDDFRADILSAFINGGLLSGEQARQLPSLLLSTGGGQTHGAGIVLLRWGEMGVWLYWLAAVAYDYANYHLLQHIPVVIIATAIV